MRGNLWIGKTRGQEEGATVLKHPAMMPLWLAMDHIRSWSNEGDSVLDPFLGSGTTLKAAKLLKRFSIGIEIAKEYCELTVRRINKPMPLFDGRTS
jgi:DNA modification methylase